MMCNVATYGPSGPLKRHVKLVPTRAAMPAGQLTARGREPVSLKTNWASVRSVDDRLIVLVPHAASSPQAATTAQKPDHARATAAILSASGA